MSIASLFASLPITSRTIRPGMATRRRVNPGRIARIALIGLSFLVLACAGGGPKGPPADLVTGKADGHVEIVDEGPVVLGDSVMTTLEPNLAAAWSFELSETTTVRFTTESAVVDTTLYILQDDVELAFNDDFDGLLSNLEVTLAPGSYRVIVGTYNHADRGPVTLRTTGCVGCMGAPECLNCEASPPEIEPLPDVAPNGCDGPTVSQSDLRELFPVAAVEPDIDVTTTEAHRVQQECNDTTGCAAVTVERAYSFAEQQLRAEEGSSVVLDIGRTTLSSPDGQFRFVDRAAEVRYAWLSSGELCEEYVSFTTRSEDPGVSVRIWTVQRRTFEVRSRTAESERGTSDRHELSEASLADYCPSSATSTEELVDGWFEPGALSADVAAIGTAEDEAVTRRCGDHTGCTPWTGSYGAPRIRSLEVTDPGELSLVVSHFAGGLASPHGVPTSYSLVDGEGSGTYYDVFGYAHRRVPFGRVEARATSDCIVIRWQYDDVDESDFGDAQVTQKVKVSVIRR